MFIFFYLKLLIKRMIYLYNFFLIYYFVIRVFLEVQSDQLERSQYSLIKMVEVCVVIVGVFFYIWKVGVFVGVFVERKDMDYLICIERLY